VEIDAREAYTRWAPSYPAEPHNPFMRIEDEAMTALLPPLAGTCVLDAACGTGRYLARMHGAATFAVGADLSPAMLGPARAAGLPVVCADLRAMPFADAAFGLVVCALAVGHVATLDHAMAEFARLLRPGGHLVWSDMHPDGARAGWQRTFEGDDGRLYAVTHHLHTIEEQRRASAAAGLSIEAVREPCIDFEHPWRGRPAVLAMRARREG
jgi:malonyl-CoA O-methyltransferase